VVLLSLERGALDLNTTLTPLEDVKEIINFFNGNPSEREVFFMHMTQGLVERLL